MVSGVAPCTSLLLSRLRSSHPRGGCKLAACQHLWLEACSGRKLFLLLFLVQEIFQDKDHLNQRYHRKRALYLAHIAQHLSKKQLFGSIKFAYANSNHLKPVLLLRPQGTKPGASLRFLTGAVALQSLESGLNCCTKQCLDWQGWSETDTGPSREQSWSHPPV